MNNINVKSSNIPNGCKPHIKDVDNFSNEEKSGTNKSAVVEKAEEGDVSHIDIGSESPLESASVSASVSPSASVPDYFINGVGMKNIKIENGSFITNSKNFNDVSYHNFSDSWEFSSVRSNKENKEKENAFYKYFDKNLSKHLNKLAQENNINTTNINSNINNNNSSCSFINEWLKDVPASFLPADKEKGYRDISLLNNINKREPFFGPTNNQLNIMNAGDLKGFQCLNKFPGSIDKNYGEASNTVIMNRKMGSSNNNNNNNINYKNKLNSNTRDNNNINNNININNDNIINTNNTVNNINNGMHGYSTEKYLADAYKSKEDPNSIYGSRIIEKELNDPSYFENMVGDLRLTFVNWLKKTQMIFIREKDKLLKDKKELELEKMKIYKEIENKRMLEEEKLVEERKKLDADICNSYKQLKKEKEENRKRFDEERLRFLQEIDRIKLLLSVEKERYYQEYKKFEVEKKKIVDANIATETLIDINIGGAVFETSRHTLTQQKNSFLDQLLSGRHKVTRDKNGRIFLDRDSELFRIILNFLRNPGNVPVPKDLNESESLLKEAEFYGINFVPFPLAFTLGGFDGVDYLNSVELLDISQQCWRMCTPMATKKAYFGSAVLNNFLYVFGGNNYDYKALFETEVYDRLRDVWFVASNLNIPRRNNSGVTLNGRIFCIGGYDGTAIIPNVEAYDHRMKAWVEVAPLNTARSSTMSVVMDNKIYVIGGTNGERLKSIEVYDEKMNVWEKFPHDLLEARSSGSAFAYLNQLYVMGGVDNEHNTLNSVEQYQSYNKRWQFMSNLPENKMNFAAATLSDSYIITGGENGGVLNTCHFFSPDTNEWQYGPPLLVPRFGHSVLVANL